MHNKKLVNSGTASKVWSSIGTIAIAALSSTEDWELWPNDYPKEGSHSGPHFR